MLFTQKTTYASILNATYTPLISNELGELKETLTKAKNGIIISMKNGWNKILPG